MSWFRSHARLGSCVALLALALQLVLSFGHIHRKDILAVSAPTSQVADLVSTSDGRHAAANPADRATHDHEDEYCAIYAINGLLGCAQHAAPPSLPLPLALSHALPPIGSESPRAEPRRGLSQARAPPIA
jgi:hypothetical protein